MPELAPQADVTETVETTEKKGKRAKAPKPEGEKSVNRSNFAKLYPEDAPVKLLVEANPKKKNSKSADRFEAWFGSSTVGEYLSKGGTYQDIAYDVGRGFVQIG